VAERLDVMSALSRSYLFEDLTAEDLRPLASFAVVRRLVRGEAVCRANDPADDLFIVVSGEIKASVVNLDGEEVVHQLYGAGMTAGEPGYFSVDRTRIVDVMAVEPSVVILLHRRELTPFLQRHVEVKDRALEGLASASRWQTSLISSLATRPLVDRLIQRLLELADSNGDQVAGQAVRTPKISQTTLAAMIGVSRENVNRALATLTAQGSIRRESGYYVLVDEAGLRREATKDWLMGTRRDRRAEP
jgi:CRP/FNR family transcriptional regulator, cyclic AMP receptor protein